MSVDHILPVSASGDDRAINLVTCCRQCNSQKADKTFKKNLQRQLFAAIHERNIIAGIEDNQRIDLGSTSASARNDIEAKSLPELGRICDLMVAGKEDPLNGFLASVQIMRIATLRIKEIAEELSDEDLMNTAEKCLERFGLVMAEAENNRYQLDESTPRYTKPLFDMYDFVPFDEDFQ